MEALEKKVLDLLKNNPMKAGDAVKELGVDKKEFDKVMKALKEEEKIESPKRCFWQTK